MKPVSPVLPNQPTTKTLEVVFAADQPEYQPLPAICCDNATGEMVTVITRWKLTLWERLTVALFGSFFFQQLMFHQTLSCPNCHRLI